MTDDDLVRALEWRAQEGSTAAIAQLRQIAEEDRLDQELDRMNAAAAGMTVADWRSRPR